MNYSPHFSLIVPVYNTAAFLPRCVQSILEQDFEDYELILVDDGSSDDSPALCDAYAAQQPQVRVIHKPNGGVSSARNTGLEIARGKWIWFIDSDDFIHPHALRELQSAQEAQLAQLYVFNEKRAAYHSGTMDELLETYYFSYVLGFAPWNKLYKRELLDTYKLRFDTEETIGEDLLFNLEYYSHINSVCFLGRDYYKYDVREGSAMTTRSRERHINQMRLFGKIRQKLRGCISPLNMGILYFLHLVGGLHQSAEGGLSWWRRAQLAGQYRKDFPGSRRLYRQALRQFLAGEHASWLGGMRLRILLSLFSR